MIFLLLYFAIGLYWAAFVGECACKDDRNIFKLLWFWIFLVIVFLLWPIVVTALAAKNS